MTVPILRAALLLLVCAGSAIASEPLTLVTLADATRGTKSAMDIGPPGPSQGDLFVFEQPLMDEQRRDIGHNNGYCVTTLPGVHSQCQWTLLFTNDNGVVVSTLVVAGQEYEAGPSTVAVIGGTGTYAGYGGTLLTTPNPDGTFTQVLHLQPR